MAPRPVARSRAPRRKALPRARAVLRRVWVWAGLALLCAVSVEALSRLILRVVSPQQSFDQVVVTRRAAEGGAAWLSDYERDERGVRAHGWEPREYVRFGEAPYEGKVLSIEKDGTRRTWNAPGTEGAPLVLVLGGSTAWGWGARDERTIPSLLARLLHERGVPARVRNLAAPGWISTQELIGLQLELQKGARPAVVVALDGLNEVLTPMGTGQPAGGTAWPITAAEREIRRLNGRPLLLLAKRALRSSATRRLYDHLRGRDEASWPPSLGGPFDSLSDDIARIYTANAAAVEGLGARFGFAPLLYWQPVIATKKQVSPAERDELALEPALRGEDRELFRLTTRKVRRAMKADPRWRDVSAALDDEAGSAYTDGEHYTEASNERLARLMAPDVARALRARAGLRAPGRR